jgi:hypothetical protein
MAQPTNDPNWTSEHEDALAALTGLKIPKKEAESLVRQVPGTDAGTLTSNALRLRAQQSQRVVPAGAAPPATPPPVPSQRTSRATPPPLPATPPPLPPRAPIGPSAPDFGWTYQRPNFLAGLGRVLSLGQPTPAPTAPLAPGQPPPRHLAVPVQVQPPTSVPEHPLGTVRNPVTIQTMTERNNLKSGDHYVWPDGFIYRKK